MAEHEGWIAVVVGGASPEAEVSRASGRAVAAALAERGYIVELVEAEPRALARLLEHPPAAAWLATHGPLGEDGALQGWFEVARIPYTGSGVLASALAMDKWRTRQLAAAAGIAVAPGVCVDLAGVDRFRPPAAWTWPLVVKPVRGGSSIGTALVEEPAALREALYAALAFDDRVLVERFVAGRELSVGLLDDEPLGLIEVQAADRFYTYQAKYGGENRYLLDPELPSDAREATLAAARTLVEVLGCEGLVRVDFILAEDGEPVLLEVNTIPGMTPHSLLPRIGTLRGYDFGDLVEEALARARLHW